MVVNTLQKALLRQKQKHLDKLDAIRGFAAVYVVFYHFFGQAKLLPNIVEKAVFSFGQEAVILFFLLSGFVIYVSVERSSKITFQSYFMKRFRRIYFPFFISIVVSLLVFYLNGNLGKAFSWPQLLGNLAMLQDFSGVKPGGWVRNFLDNYPLWSLSYEWWFYLLFFPCYFVFKDYKPRIYFVLAFSAISFVIYANFPNKAALTFAYFIIWWCGLEAADVYLRHRKFTFNNMKPVIFSLLFMSILVALPILTVEKIQFGFYPFLIFRHFFASLLAVAIGLLWYRHKLLYFDNILGIFTTIAPISYGLYVLHYPLLIQLNLSSYISNQWLDYGIKFALIFGLAYLTEIKLQPLVNKLLK
jgi:peptidoglycan/LPS O-acetylase OafA/YrhL